MCAACQSTHQGEEYVATGEEEPPEGPVEEDTSPQGPDVDGGDLEDESAPAGGTSGSATASATASASGNGSATATATAKGMVFF